MADPQTQILEHATSLKGAPLDTTEFNWINYVCTAIFVLFERLYENDAAVVLATEACMVALSSLVRRNRFPVSFSVLSWNDLAMSQLPTKCDYSNPWEVNTMQTQPEGNYYFKQSIMIGWMTHYAGNAPLKSVYERLGPCVFLEDEAGQQLPCVASPANFSCANQVFLSTSWTYCPFLTPIALNDEEALPYSGFFEVRDSVPLPSSQSVALRSRFAPNGSIAKDLVLSVDSAFDSTTKRFKRACLPPQRSTASLHGKLRRKTSLLPLTGDEIGILLELESKKGSTISIMVLDSSDTRPAIAAASLLKIGSQLIVTYLKTSLARPDHIKAIPRLLATAETHFIPLEDLETSETSALKRPKTAETASSDPLFSYSGLITCIHNSHCMELDERYLVCAHRSEHGLALLRKGSAVTLHFVHPIYDDGLLIGIGLCSHSTIEVVEFPSTYEPPEHPTIQVQNPAGEFPCIGWALFVENARMQLAKHCVEVKTVGLPSFTEFLLNIKSAKWRIGLFSKRDAYHEWFAHESGSVGGNIGCQASGSEYKAFPRMMTLEFFCNLKMFAGTLSSRRVDWTCEVMNPVPFLEDFQNRVMVGRLTLSTSEFQVLSNYAWFQSLNGLFQVPIVVTGLHLHHLYIPCRLKSFALVKENTVPHYGELMGGFSVPRFSPPFGLYFVCDIEHIQFLWNPVPRCIDLEQHIQQERPRDEFTFRLIRRNLPEYFQSHQGNTICMGMLVKPLGSQANTVTNNTTSKKNPQDESLVQLSFKNIHNMQLYPILHERHTYSVSPVVTIRGTKGSTHLECTTPSSLFELWVPSSSVRSAVSSEVSESVEVSLRDFLYKSSPLHKSPPSSVVFKAVIVARYQEKVIASSDRANGAVRFLDGCETEIRSNAGDIKLVLRALDTPDVLTAYFKPGRISLPLGLVPGCIVEIKRAHIELGSKQSLLVSFGSFPNRAASCDISVIGFDPAVCRGLGLSLWNSTIQSPALVRSESPLIAQDSNLIRKLCYPGGLQGLLIEDIDWIGQGTVPYRDLIEVPLAFAMDRRTFRTRVSLLKVYDFSIETRCRSCGAASSRGTCTRGCEEKGMNLYTRMTGLFHDGTAKAKLSASGSSVWPLLSISSADRDRLTSLAERISSIRYEGKQLVVPDNSGLANKYLDEEDEVLEAFRDSDGLKSIPDLRALDILKKVLVNSLGEQAIVIGTYFASNREDDLPFSDLPYLVTKRKTEKAEIERDSVQSKSQLTRPTPNIDVVWACKVRSVITNECRSLIDSLQF